MFETDMREKRESVVEITDAAMVDVHQLVVYMYTGRIEEDYKRYRELLKLADKYGVLELSNVCGNKLAKTLTRENALELGIFGDTHNSETLIYKAGRCLLEEIRGRPNLMAHMMPMMRDMVEEWEDADGDVERLVQDWNIQIGAGGGDDDDDGWGDDELEWG